MKTLEITEGNTYETESGQSVTNLSVLSKQFMLKWEVFFLPPMSSISTNLKSATYMQRVLFVQLDSGGSPVLGFELMTFCPLVQQLNH